MRRTASAVSLLVALLVGATPATAATSTSYMRDDYFSPPSPWLTAPGDVVTWVNVGTRRHTTTDNTPLKLWNRTADPGQSVSKTFISAGRYSYFCSLHPSSMRGSVYVPMKVRPATGTTATYFAIRWASVTAPAGWQYVIQVRRPGNVIFYPWKTATAPYGTYRSTTKGTHYFQAKLQRKSGTWPSSAFSPIISIKIG